MSINKQIIILNCLFLTLRFYLKTLPKNSTRTRQLWLISRLPSWQEGTLPKSTCLTTAHSPSKKRGENCASDTDKDKSWDANQIKNCFDDGSAIRDPRRWSQQINPQVERRTLAWHLSCHQSNVLGKQCDVLSNEFFSLYWVFI